MKKKLNTETAQQALLKLGLNQSDIADRLDVSKEAVSQWLLNKSFPRPNKLLKLGKLLNLPFDSLVVAENPHQPRVAFRKMAGTKTTKQHLQKAREKGRLLRHLTPYLPPETLEMPPVLKNPSCDYEYLSKVASKVRADINVGPEDPMDFAHLIRRFDDLQTTLIPGMWGAKQRHENAVHIFLPDSQTTWVYLNLDTNVHDFKFWMAHELGHCLSPSLEGEEAEDFADAFAASLLYPHKLAVDAYHSIGSQRSASAKISHLFELADRLTISAWTVFKQANKYAEHAGLPQIKEPNGFPGAVTNFNKQYPNVSQALLGSTQLDEHGRPSARDYIDAVESAFETKIFDLLRAYIRESGKGPSFTQSVLDLPLLDAKSLHAELA